MALCKAVITCMLLSLLYKTEIWYSGCMKPGWHAHTPTISIYMDWYVDIAEKTLILAIYRILSVYYTTLIVTLF